MATDDDGDDDDDGDADGGGHDGDDNGGMDWMPVGFFPALSSGALRTCATVLFFTLSFFQTLLLASQT